MSLPMIVGHVPSQIVCTVSVFLDFCYLVCRDELNEDILVKIEDATAHFKKEHIIFEVVGVRDNFNISRQHFITYYHSLIPMFGALNGLCSSITKSKHTKAVKELYHCTSKFGQAQTFQHKMCNKVCLSWNDHISPNFCSYCSYFIQCSMLLHAPSAYESCLSHII